MSGDISLSINKEIVTPIVEAKIKGAVIDAMGGFENIANDVIDAILRTKVDKDGKVNPSSYYNNQDFIDVLMSNQIKTAVMDEIRAQVQSSSQTIKTAIVNQLKTKKYQTGIATALLNCLIGTFESDYTSNITISLKKSCDD